MEVFPLKVFKGFKSFISLKIYLKILSLKIFIFKDILSVCANGIIHRRF